MLSVRRRTERWKGAATRARRPAKKPDGHRSRKDAQNGDLQALTHEARRLGQTGKWGPEAVWVNTRILELDPGNLAALTRRCYQEQGNFPAAKEDYSRALQIYPESALVKEALGRIEREEKRAPAKAGRAKPRADGAKGAQERTAERARKGAEDLRRVEIDRADWIDSVLKRLLANQHGRGR